MIAYNKIELEKAAKQAGFVRDTFERTKNKKCKVFRLESDEKMRSYMTDKGFAVKAMRYGEMVAVFAVQTEGVDKILAETGLELSEEERKSAALIYSWYPMTYIRNGEGVPVRLINKMMRAAEKVMWDRGIHYAAGIIDYGVTRAMGTFGRSRYEERGDFQKENGEMQTLFWKDLKKVESHLMNGEDDCPWFRIEQAQEQIAGLVVEATAKLVAAKQNADSDRELYNQFIAKTGEKID